MLSLSTEQLSLQTRIRAFVDRHMRDPDAIEQHGRFRLDLFQELGRQGFLGLTAPESLGGAGAGHVEKNIVLCELSRVCAGFSLSVMTHYLCIGALLAAGNATQQQRWIPGLASGQLVGCFAVTEPGGGSSLGRADTSAEKTETGWRLSGLKRFITNAAVADVCVLTATTKGPEKEALSSFVVPGKTEGVKPGEPEEKFGLCGCLTGDLALNDVRLGDDALLGQAGGGVRMARSVIGETGRGGMAAIGVGLTKASLDAGVAFAKQRMVAGKPMTMLPSAQFAIAEMRADFEAAQLLTFNASARCDAKLSCQTELSIAKLFATEAAVRTAQKAMDMMGGYGVIGNNPITRYLRDALAAIPSCGTTQIQKIIIAGETCKENG